MGYPFTWVPTHPSTSPPQPMHTHSPYRRTIICIVALFVLCMNLAATGAANDKLPLPQTSNLTECPPTGSNTSLVVAVPPYPPYTQARDGSPEGMLIDIVKTAAREVDMRIILRQVPLSQIPQLLQTGEVDAAFPLYQTPKNAEWGIFCPTPISRVETIALFAQHTPPKKFDGAIASLAQVPVGIVAGHSYGFKLDYALQQKVLHRVLTYPDFVSCYHALLDGDIAVMPMDTLLAKELNRRHNYQKPLLHFATLEQTAPMVLFALTARARALCKIFTRGLDIIQENGVATRIRSVFIGTYYGE